MTDGRSGERPHRRVSDSILLAATGSFPAVLTKALSHLRSFSLTATRDLLWTFGRTSALLSSQFLHFRAAVPAEIPTQSEVLIQLLPGPLETASGESSKLPSFSVFGTPALLPIPIIAQV